jgi:UDP-N-acetylglucosamine 2-epimerase (non-hydrolysing)
MIDSLINYTSKINYNEIADKYNVIADNYIIITLHRPSNVDDVENLSELVSLIQDISAKSKIIFSVHPRTKKYLEKYNLIKNLNGNVQLTEPLGYIEFITLVKKASLVITDSGGIQEETTFLKVPCITLRTSTERPVTVDIGTNYLVGNDLSKARELTFSIIGGNSKSGEIPPLWDGKTSERIVEILVKIKN